MEELCTEQRLRLVQQIRQEHHQNRQTLKARENILYGQESVEHPYTEDIYHDAQEKGVSSFGFGMRLLLAVLLFIGYFFLLRSEGSIGGWNAQRIQSEVNRYSDAAINVFDFIDNITYTLGIDSIQKE